MKYFIYCRKSQEAEDRQIMSLESQADEVQRIIGSDTSIEIVDTYTEAYSAKQPGRPLFNEMVKRIEKGHAQGIISWHPDRLARNSMDGGQIIYLLDQGKLTDLKFANYSFENSSQGKFMLSIMFGQSKYYVDNLSENVKRGQRTKLKNGWKPNMAPIGYKNCPETKTILPNKEHFKVVRNIFELLLSGGHSVLSIHRIVCDEWGYTTPQHKTKGGKKPAVSTLYKMLSNPFYAGFILWNGQIYEGRHKPVVTKQEFERAQILIGGKTKIKPKKHAFAYAGLLRCGACGLSVTAEYKRKPSGRAYTYYHCTRVHRTPKCTQPSIEVRQLESQIVEFMKQLSIAAPVFDWLAKQLSQFNGGLKSEQEAITEKHALAVSDYEKQISNLTDLRLRDVLTDDEFTNKRKNLQISIASAQEKAENSRKEKPTFEPLKILSMFNARAVKYFIAADAPMKRKLLKLLCYNPTLKDKKVFLEARYPFTEMLSAAGFPRLCGKVENVRTLPLKLTKAQANKLAALAKDTEIKELALEVAEFIRQVEPQILQSLSEVQDFLLQSHIDTDTSSIADYR